MKVRLGPAQSEMLQKLQQHRRWWAGCKWHWAAPSTTMALLDALVKKGHVVKVTLFDGRPLYKIAKVKITGNENGR